jgi:hypothetical protein
VLIPWSRELPTVGFFGIISTTFEGIDASGIGLRRVTYLFDPTEAELKELLYFNAIHLEDIETLDGITYDGLILNFCGELCEEISHIIEFDIGSNDDVAGTAQFLDHRYVSSELSAICEVEGINFLNGDARKIVFE